MDHQIIASLQEDSRLSLSKIADKLGTSSSTAQKHIKKLEDKGVLKGYTVVIDPTKLGYCVTAVVFVQVEGEHLLNVENEIAKEDNVLAVYDITGDYDAALVTKFKDTGSLNAFVKRLLSMRYVKRTVTNVAFNVIKEEFTPI